MVLAGLLLLAGCSAVGTPGQREPTPTLTPAPVPGDASAEAARARPDFLRAPVEPWTVGDAHAATLTATNYTWVLARNVTTYRRDLPNSDRETVRVVRVANATTYRVDRRVRETNASGLGPWRAATTEYAAGGVAFERRPPGAAVGVRPVERPRNGEGVVDDRAEALVARYLAADRLTVSRVREDGERLYLLRGRGAPPEVTTLANGSVSGYRVAALVRPDGRVTALRVRWREGSRTFVTIESRYRAVGNTSVTPPDWVADAPPRERAAAANASRSADNWFADAELRAAAGSGSGSENGTGGWVGWPAWAQDD